MTITAQVCDPALYSHIDPDNKTSCEKCPKQISSLMGEIYELFYDCTHGTTDPYNAWANCVYDFKTVLTEDGICFTFNGLDVYRNENIKNNSSEPSVSWTLEDGFLINDERMAPLRGSKKMLDLHLQDFSDSVGKSFCRGSLRGFKFYLHLPTESPALSKHFYQVPHSSLFMLWIEPKMIVTAPELRNLPVSKRQCYFNNERYLRFFRYYTQKNCEVECLANMTIRKCGCQRFFMKSK
jgi:acid-sensing ion channel, other